MITSDLHRALSELAPIDGVSIGRRDDKSTWRIDFKTEATKEQQAVAQTFLRDFSVDSHLFVALKARLLAQIDADAETFRLRYITPGNGMQMTYAEKLAQARAVQGLGKEAADAVQPTEMIAQYPTLAASVGLEAATLWDCANLVLAKYAQFAALSNGIERRRLSGKKAIAEAKDVASAQAAYEAIVWT